MKDLFVHEGITFERIRSIPCKCPSCDADLFRSVGHVPSQENPLLLVCINPDCNSDAAEVGSSSTVSLEDAHVNLKRAIFDEEKKADQDRAERMA